MSPQDASLHARAATVAPLVAVNDFVVKFANVNGSGSASANQLFAKAILRMGIPVTPRNISAKWNSISLARDRPDSVAE